MEYICFHVISFQNFLSPWQFHSSFPVHFMFHDAMYLSHLLLPPGAMHTNALFLFSRVSLAFVLFSFVLAQYTPQPPQPAHTHAPPPWSSARLNPFWLRSSGLESTQPPCGSRVCFGSVDGL
jgi:hypothetical protein